MPVLCCEVHPGTDACSCCDALWPRPVTPPCDPALWPRPVTPVCEVMYCVWWLFTLKRLCSRFPSARKFPNVAFNMNWNVNQMNHSVLFSSYVGVAFLPYYGESISSGSRGEIFPLQRFLYVHPLFEGWGFKSTLKSHKVQTMFSKGSSLCFAITSSLNTAENRTSTSQGISYPKVSPQNIWIFGSKFLHCLQHCSCVMNSVLVSLILWMNLLMEPQSSCDI